MFLKAIKQMLTFSLQAIIDSWVGSLIGWVPWFEPLIYGALRGRGLLLNTTKAVIAYQGPLLLLHAKVTTDGICFTYIILIINNK